ncbi:hypothetical protein GCM10011518_29170 [Flavobacterium limi]|uniref:Uncharacterized protein n=1 Tax=Flavobacterium limi TaxID=2045105 RepID=A0ABQ1UFM3_9FLAO|nr:hypothetical protein GCM10011518_29170 [Flavobacterium limi]
MDSFKDLIFTSLTILALVLLFSNSEEEFVVTSGVIISEGKLIGEVLLILIEASFEILKVNKSSIASQELKNNVDKNAKKTSFDFIVNIIGYLCRYEIV